MHWVLIWVLFGGSGSLTSGSAYFAVHDQCNAAIDHMTSGLKGQPVQVIYSSCEVIAEGGMPTRENRSP
jgi:hypothetical protein